MFTDTALLQKKLRLQNFGQAMSVRQLIVLMCLSGYSTEAVIIDWIDERLRAGEPLDSILLYYLLHALPSILSYSRTLPYAIIRNC